MVKGSLCHRKNCSDMLQQENFQAGVGSYEKHSFQGNLYKIQDMFPFLKKYGCLFNHNFSSI